MFKKFLIVLLLLLIYFITYFGISAFLFDKELKINNENLLSQLENFQFSTTTKPLNVFVLNSFLKQGETLVVIADNVKSKEIRLEFENKFYEFFPIINKERKVAVVGIDLRKAPGEYPLKVYVDNEEKLNQLIKVNKGDFYETKFILSKELKDKGYTQKNIISQIQTNDGIIIQKTVGEYTSKNYFQEPFIYPLDSISIVGDFGVLRKENNLSLRHLGVDLDAPLNTPVYAINSGVVKLTKEFKTYGKTVVINHGLGIYSLYLHLNDIKVKEGEEVKRGEVIGLVGNTGYSLGPHLHFSIKVNEASVNPLNFIEIANKIFN